MVEILWVDFRHGERYQHQLRQVDSFEAGDIGVVEMEKLELRECVDGTDNVVVDGDGGESEILCRRCELDKFVDHEGLACVVDSE